jgi:phospholipid N-methyltransferase
MLNPDVWQGFQERQRAIIKILVKQVGVPLSDLSVLEIGAGSGGNLLELLRMGFRPEKLSANELLPERLASLRRNLPSACCVLESDATKLDIARESVDIVYQSTVFSSLLDDTFQQQLADKMWAWVRPGGGVLWYDFTYNNPRNPDVRGVPIKRIRELFPQADVIFERVTLAPPISRRVCRLHPYLYHVFNVIPLLRTHVLCWIGKRK